MPEMTAKTEKPSMWRVKNTSFDFFLFLIKLKLTTKQIRQADIEKMIRRQRSTYSKSTGPTPSVYDGGLI
jgi:hypothetical protein